MKKKYKYNLINGPIIIIVAVALQAFCSGMNPFITRILITFGFILIINGVYRHKKYGEMIEKDERTKKISAFAISYSWLATIITMSVLILLDYFDILKMTAPQALGFTYFVMILVVLVFKWYFQRKGDIE